MSITYDIIESWNNTVGTVSSMEELRSWIDTRNQEIKVDIRKVDFSYHGFWYYDEKDGYIRNQNNSFFQVAGYQEIENDQIICEQPIIIQDEIGYLGIICKKIGGSLNFLMQAKIEPGNINKIQISPTIQATKSNFTRMHGGNAPAYLDYFVQRGRYTVIVDQIQSEQSSRFYKKRNRNIIIYVDDDVELLDSHRWMTLGQIKEFMKEDNLVNMDTRTVLSCLPFPIADLSAEEKKRAEKCFHDKALYVSMSVPTDYKSISSIYTTINDYKMYRSGRNRLVPLKSLKSWCVSPKEIYCRKPYDFKVIYCFIEIEGREVKYWEQPLFEATSPAIFGIFTCVQDGVRKFMVRTKVELGCFDGAELGPVVQLEPTNPRNELNSLERLFLRKLEKGTGVMKDVMLSEEGGRFYHEENRNVIIEIDPKDTGVLPQGYFWVNYSTLNAMVQFNNVLNIQLRNLLALLDI